MSDELEIRRQTGARGLSLAVTNLTKLAGLGLVINDATNGGPPIDALTLAFYGFLIAGAQFSETVLLALIDRFFGRNGVK